MTRRESRLAMALRRWWARAIVALTAALAFAYAWWYGWRLFSEELDMEFLAWPVGIGLAIGGYLLVGLVYRRSGPRVTSMHLTWRVLAKQLDAKLRTLPAHTHTIHALGDPWPKAVIGPTGVCLVEPVSVGDHHVGYLDGEILLDGRPAGSRLLGEVRRLLPSVQDLLHDRMGLDVPVRGIIAVDDATIVPAPLRAGRLQLRVVPLSDLPQAISIGEPLTRDTTQRVADAIARWRP